MKLAPALLGTLVCHLINGTLLTAVIVETEAYLGPEDRASHARAGLTPRTWPMFGPPGHAYVYRLYGMHWAFNVVGHGGDEEAGAVLIRAALPVAGVDLQRQRRGRPRDPVERLAAGPARLCQSLGITGADTGADLTEGPPLWIAPAPVERPNAAPDETSRPMPGLARPTAVVRGPRINVAYAGDPWATRLYRFGWADSPALSRRFPITAPGEGT